MHHRMAWLVAWGLLLKAPGQAAQASEDGGAAAATGTPIRLWVRSTKNPYADAD